LSKAQVWVAKKKSFKKEKIVKRMKVVSMKELKKKQGTKELVRELRKASRERKEKIWKDIASRLSKPSRQMARVNIGKISKMAAKNKGKTLVVPGKVLASGELETEAIVSALAFSDKAREKLARKGKTMTIRELVESGEKAEKMVIVL